MLLSHLFLNTLDTTHSNIHQQQTGWNTPQGFMLYLSTNFETRYLLSSWSNQSIDKYFLFSPKFMLKVASSVFRNQCAKYNKQLLQAFFRKQLLWCEKSNNSCFFRGAYYILIYHQVTNFVKFFYVLHLFSNLFHVWHFLPILVSFSLTAFVWFKLLTQQAKCCKVEK